MARPPGGRAGRRPGGPARRPALDPKASPDRKVAATAQNRVQGVVLRVFVIAVVIAGVATTVAVCLGLRQDRVPSGRLGLLVAVWVGIEVVLGLAGTLGLRRVLRRRLGESDRGDVG